MNIVIILFALLILILACYIVFMPEKALALANNHAANPKLKLIASLARIILGVVLILNATHTKHPELILIFGWLVLVAGIVFAIMPGDKFTQLILWVIEKFKNYIRFMAGFGILLAVFLIYSVI
jgi:hypothetical protein